MFHSCTIKCDSISGFIWLELVNANINKVKLNIKNYEKQGVMNIYEEALI